MGNSISTTSNTPTATNSTPVTFKAGDAVLCPSLSSEPFTLTSDPYKARNDLALQYEGSYFYYNHDGYFIRASQNETDSFQPSLYHDTPANRQAINTLYGNSAPSQRKLIDLTSPNDTEVILMPAMMLADIACDMEGAAQTLHDLCILLHLIHREKITPQQAIAMTRLSHDATHEWAELLYNHLEPINHTLSSTRFGKAGKQ